MSIGFLFHERAMEISYSVNKSDAVAKAEGTFVPREKRKLETKSKSGSKKAAKGDNGSRMEIGGDDENDAPAPAPAKLAARENLPPNRTLLARNLPEECTKDVLTQLFKQYHGFKEVRMIPGKKGFAFVDYEAVLQASNALQGLYGFKLTQSSLLDINFAK
jgi:RNA recognition motif-containing protein